MELNLAGQVAIVTGASRGIGAGIADMLCAAGARVAGTATTADGASAITERLAGIADGGSGEVLDVNDANGASELVKKVTDTLGVPTILVNNAGITRDQILIRMKEEDWDAVIKINLKGTFNCSKSVAKYMMRQKSTDKIVNISSVIGLVGNIGQVNYAASKAGIIGLTKSMAKELASRNINVNAIAPGFIDTDMTKKLPEKVRQDLQQHIPLKRLGTVEDIAKVVNFLVSDAANYITGQVINVDGGMVM